MEFRHFDSMGNYKLTYTLRGCSVKEFGKARDEG
jgi:hypothetical protein